uniref:MARVEL domain-containing protein n=1 Tax=Loa loa TaxID=7209 RepID=A0A1I7VXD5_LOALO
MTIFSHTSFFKNEIFRFCKIDVPSLNKFVKLEVRVNAFALSITVVETTIQSYDENVTVMGFKVTPATTPETTSKEPKTGRTIRNQFWSTGFAKSDEQTPKRPETTVSRQFLPKKKHGISEVWSKQMQESRDDLKQPFPYTPFKLGSLNKKTSVNILHDGTLNTQLNQDLSQIYGTQQQPGTSAIPRPEPKGIWRGPQSGIIPPPPAPYRPSSAMNINIPVLSRPASRANSDLGIGTIAFCDSIGNVPSRYQSYCTLPRPEQIDFDQHSNYGNEISQMAKQINQLYGHYNAQVQPSASPNPISKQGILPGSRPASSMLVGAPGMASDYLTRQHSTTLYGPAESNVIPQISDDEILKPAKEIIYFDALSILSVLQVLFSLVIFGCGVLRIIWNSKWAVGIELVLAALIFSTGVTGICASSRRSYSAATATYTLSMLNSILSLIPSIMGTLPAIANAFPTLNLEWLLDVHESLTIDYLLSFTCFAETVIAMITSIYGCKALGLTMRLVEKLRFSVDLNTVFKSLSPVNQNELDRMDRKKAIDGT